MSLWKLKQTLGLFMDGRLALQLSKQARASWWQPMFNSLGLMLKSGRARAEI
jgi:hypothetical protein